MPDRPITTPMRRFDFQDIVERLPLVVYIDRLDELSSPLYISPEIENLLGYTREEWLADPELFTKSLHPDDRDRVLEEIRERNQTHEPISYRDYRLIARDGRVVWVWDDEVVVPGRDGGPAVSQGYLQDVTSRRRDSMRLELLVGILGLAAEERTPEEIVTVAAGMLAAAVGDVDVTFVEIEPDGTLRARYSTESNGPVVDTLAVPGYLARLERGPIVVADVRREAWLVDVQADLVGKGVGSAVDVPLRRDGSLVGVLWFNTPEPRDWHEHEVTVLSEVAEQLASVLANAEAREERRRAELERERSAAILREHEQKLRAVFETAHDAIFITDDERRTVDANPAACEYLGVSKRDLIGRRVDDFLPPDRLATVEEDWAAYVAGGPVLQEWENLRPDGTLRVAEASAHPNFLPGLHIAFLRDITERKQLEAELVNAQKLESLGRLAGGVAHDFNNLLTGITGYATLLLEREQGDPELRRDLGEIVRAAERAAELTKQLLAFGRRQLLKPRALDLRAVVADLRPLLERLLGEDVVLEVRDAQELGTVRADPGQIEQVIVNLAVNARDAMPRGGRFTIETRDRDSWVELVCSDTGSGMDEATLAQIFEPFFTTREQGVGLGLASVHGIVHQSSGEVRAESTPGVGSVFTVSLPRVREQPKTVTPAEQPQSRPGSETILLVEDEDVVRDLARRVLERQGYTVLACANGPAAVSLAESESRRIDLLLTDVVMPGMRGYEVARLVSASRPDIRVLFMSGYAEEALVGRAALADHPLIEKPFAVDALTRRVRETLET